MRHTPILERQVRDMLQFSLFWSYYKTRLQHKEGTLPELGLIFQPLDLRNLQQMRKIFISVLYTLVQRKHQTKIIFQEWHWKTS